jgi:hypothetical protein
VPLGFSTHHLWATKQNSENLPLVPNFYIQKAISSLILSTFPMNPSALKVLSHLQQGSLG